MHYLLDSSILIKYLNEDDFSQNLISRQDEIDDVLKNYFQKLLIRERITNKDSKLLNLITILIENFYNQLSVNNKNNVNRYFLSKSKISNLINNMKKFNLDKKNLFITINEILQNDA